MRPRGSTPSEAHLAATANRQLGLLRHADLLDAGVTQGDIARRLARHRLSRVHDRVYAFGHTALRDEGHWLAALWTLGPPDALSHFTAAAFHGWRVTVGDTRLRGGLGPDGAVHVSTTGTHRSRAALTVHRVSRLERADVFDTYPFRVTSIPRTLVDLADVMAWRDYRALADGLRRLYPQRIRQAQQRAPGRAGRGRVTRLIEADDTHTRSELERRFLRFLCAYRLPRPDDLNVSVAGHLVDCVYRSDGRLVVELDGRAFHARRAQMRADRRRDSDYQLAGYRILRLVWDDLHPDEAARTADRVRRMLAPVTA